MLRSRVPDCVDTGRGFFVAAASLVRETVQCQPRLGLGKNRWVLLHADEAPVFQPGGLSGTAIAHATVENDLAGVAVGPHQPAQQLQGLSRWVSVFVVTGN